MSTLQLKQGPTANLAIVTLASGEPAYDVTKKELRMGDGTTASGIAQARADMANVSDPNFTTSTGGLSLPRGTDAQRPTNAPQGTVRWNSTRNYAEINTTSAGTWERLGSGSGGGGTPSNALTTVTLEQFTETARPAGVQLGRMIWNLTSGRPQIGGATAGDWDNVLRASDTFRSDTCRLADNATHAIEADTAGRASHLNVTSSRIETTVSDGSNGAILTTGSQGAIRTNGGNSPIYTSGVGSSIYTRTADSDIFTIAGRIYTTNNNIEARRSGLVSNSAGNIYAQGLIRGERLSVGTSLATVYVLPQTAGQPGQTILWPTSGTQAVWGNYTVPLGAGLPANPNDGDFLQAHGGGFRWISSTTTRSATSGIADFATASIGNAGFKLPGGTTAQRLSSNPNYAIRWNTNTSKLEFYNGTAWVNVMFEGTNVSSATSADRSNQNSLTFILPFNNNGFVETNAAHGLRVNSVSGKLQVGTNSAFLDIIRSGDEATYANQAAGGRYSWGFTIPEGGTNNRSSAHGRVIRWNQTTSKLEFYDGSTYKNIAFEGSSSGGGTTVAENRLVPAGGGTGEVLGKSSNSDYATAWVNTIGHAAVSTRSTFAERSDRVGGFGIPRGTTAQRSVSLGVTLRYNTTLSQLEFYDGNTWAEVGTGSATNGEDGISVGMPYIWKATSFQNSTGEITVNNADISMATQVIIHHSDRLGSRRETLIRSWDDSTNTAGKGTLTLVAENINETGQGSSHVDFTVTRVVSGSGRDIIDVVPADTVAGAPIPFSLNDNLRVFFSRTGDKGADGSSSSVDLSTVRQVPATGTVNHVLTKTGTGADDYEFRESSNIGSSTLTSSDVYYDFRHTNSESRFTAAGGFAYRTGLSYTRPLNFNISKFDMGGEYVGDIITNWSSGFLQIRNGDNSAIYQITGKPTDTPERIVVSLTRISGFISVARLDMPKISIAHSATNNFSPAGSDSSSPVVHDYAGTNSTSIDNARGLYYNGTDLRLQKTDRYGNSWTPPTRVGSFIKIVDSDIYVAQIFRITRVVTNATAWIRYAVELVGGDTTSTSARNYTVLTHPTNEFDTKFELPTRIASASSGDSFFTIGTNGDATGAADKDVRVQGELEAKGLQVFVRNTVESLSEDWNNGGVLPSNQNTPREGTFQWNGGNTNATLNALFFDAEDSSGNDISAALREFVRPRVAGTTYHVEITSASGRYVIQALQLSYAATGHLAITSLENRDDWTGSFPTGAVSRIRVSNHSGFDVDESLYTFPQVSPDEDEVFAGTSTPATLGIANRHQAKVITAIPSLAVLNTYPNGYRFFNRADKREYIWLTGDGGGLFRSPNAYTSVTVA